ncbi:hypothetical protein B0T21DRAFT_297025, partial [Apiosordaria backusii]
NNDKPITIILFYKGFIYCFEFTLVLLYLFNFFVLLSDLLLYFTLYYIILNITDNSA